MSRASVLAVLGAVFLAALSLFASRLGSRVVSFGTPVPQPLLQLSLFPVPPRTAACLDRVAVEPGGQVALFDVDPSGKPGPKLRFSIRGASYEQSSDVAAGY